MSIFLLGGHPIGIMNLDDFEFYLTLSLFCAAFIFLFIKEKLEERRKK